MIWTIIQQILECIVAIFIFALLILIIVPMFEVMEILREKGDKDEEESI